MTRSAHLGALVLALLIASAAAVLAQTAISADGVVESTAGGFRFPDGTVQTRAAGTYAGVVLVAKAGGQHVSIQEALAAITDANEANPYLVWVGPGVYEEQVTLKPWVDIQGSGEGVTRITGPGSASRDTGTVVGADEAELRLLTVENTGAGATFAVAIYNASASPRLTRLSVEASGANDNYAVYNLSSAPTMTHVTADASGGTSSYGVFNSSSSPEMRWVTARASGAHNGIGIRNHDSSSPAMHRVTASAAGGTVNTAVLNGVGSSPQMVGVDATASGGSFAVAVGIEDDSSPRLTGVKAEASGGSFNYGITVEDTCSPVMRQVVAEAVGGEEAYAVSTYGTSASELHSSTLVAREASSANWALHSEQESSVSIAHSQLTGGVGGSGSFDHNCIGAYDGAFTGLDADCQSVP